MPDTLTITIRVVNNSIELEDNHGNKADFEIDPQDKVVWRADGSVNQWVVGFTEVGKLPFVGNIRFFARGILEEANGRNAPDDYEFWVFAEPAQPGGTALYVDPKLIIRARTAALTLETLHNYAAALEEQIESSTQLIAAADAVRLETLALARELGEGGMG